MNIDLDIQNTLKNLGTTIVSTNFSPGLSTININSTIPLYMRLNMDINDITLNIVNPINSPYIIVQHKTGQFEPFKIYSKKNSIYAATMLYENVEVLNLPSIYNYTEELVFQLSTTMQYNTEAAIYSHELLRKFMELTETYKAAYNSKSTRTPTAPTMIEFVVTIKYFIQNVQLYLNKIL